MSRHPRPRSESVLTTGIKLTSGLAGLFIALSNLALIATGKNHYGNLAVGRSMGLVGFSLMLVVAAFEARSETDTVFTVGTFNSSRMNLIAFVEVALAYLITQADFLQRLLGTASLTARQWGTSLLAAVALLACWEAGKWIARRRTSARAPAAETVVVDVRNRPRRLISTS